MALRIGIAGIDEATAAWAARLLAYNRPITILPILPDSERLLRTTITAAWPTLEKLGLIPGAAPDRYALAEQPAALLAASDILLLGAIEQDLALSLAQVAASDVLLVCIGDAGPYEALRARGHLPGRVVRAVGTAPEYLVPLVELGPAGAAAEQVAALLTGLSMHVVRLEPAGPSLASQLRAAVTQAGQALIASGQLAQAQLDEVLLYGPGLLWSVSGSGLAAAPRTRDESLLAIMRALRQHDHGAGRIVTAHEGQRYASNAPVRWQPGDAIAAPLQLFRCDVDVNWIDYNGHMTEASYLTAFGDASDALFRYLGIDEAYRAAGFSYYTVETHINYYRECGLGDSLAFTTQIINYDAKRLHLFHTMNQAVSGERLSTTEQMLLHVDTAASRTAPSQPHVADALAKIYAVHREMGRPGEVGRVMNLK